MIRARRHVITVALVATLAAPCFADTTVCGTVVTMDSPLGWNSAMTAAGGDASKAYQVLRQRYVAAAQSWPADLKAAAADAFAALDAGREKVANFDIGPEGPLSNRQGVFFGRPYAVELPQAADSALCASATNRQGRIEFATVVLSVGSAGATVIAAAIGSTADRMSELEQSFDRYLFEGYPMFPWEAMVNSLFLAKEHLADGPPRNQLVFLHPAAGLVASVQKRARSDTGTVLSVEPFGWVHYTSDYRHWMGVSVLTVFPGDRNAGVGAVLNYDEFKLGVSWHHDATGVHDGAAIFVGLDLYRFLGAKYRKLDAYRDRLRELAK